METSVPGVELGAGDDIRTSYRGSPLNPPPERSGWKSYDFHP